MEYMHEESNENELSVALNLTGKTELVQGKGNGTIGKTIMKF